MVGCAEYPFDGILGLAMPGLSQSKAGVAGNDPWYDGKLGLYRRSPCGVMFSQYCWDLLMLCLLIKSFHFPIHILLIPFLACV